MRPLSRKKKCHSVLFRGPTLVIIHTPCMTTWGKLSQKFLLFEQQAYFFPLDTLDHVTVDVPVSGVAAQNSGKFVSSKYAGSCNTHSQLHLIFLSLTLPSLWRPHLLIFTLDFSFCILCFNAIYLEFFLK